MLKPSLIWCTPLSCWPSYSLATAVKWAEQLITHGWEFCSNKLQCNAWAISNKTALGIFVIFHWAVVPKLDLMGKQLWMATLVHAVFVLGGKNAQQLFLISLNCREAAHMRGMNVHLVSETLLFTIVITDARRSSKSGFKSCYFLLLGTPNKKSHCWFITSVSDNNRRHTTPHITRNHQLPKSVTWCRWQPSLWVWLYLWLALSRHFILCLVFYSTIIL